MAANSRAARSSLLFGPLSDSETRVEERLRTLGICVCATVLLGWSLHFLRPVLVPFVLAVALKHVIAPLVDTLQLGGRFCIRLPRLVAVLLALTFASALIGILVVIVADSVRQFSAHADVYSKQVERIFASLFSWMDRKGVLAVLIPSGSPHVTWHTLSLPTTRRASLAVAGINNSVRLEKLRQLGGSLPLTSIILDAVESLLETLSNVLLVLLFAVYLLLGSDAPSAPGKDHAFGGATGLRTRASSLRAQVDAQIRSFIKGKVLLSMLIGVSTGLILSLLHVDLWLVFGVLAFWLNVSAAPPPGSDA